MISTQLKEILERHQTQGGYSLFGATAFERPLSFEIYERWLAENHHGTMDYLERHREAKADPQSRFPRMQTALCFAFPYRPHPEPREVPFRAARIASYALGGDYHLWLRERLEPVMADLRAAFPDDIFESHTDSSPIMERDLAVRAGLGWIGKNGCVIHPKQGSFFLIGEILTSLSLEGAALEPLPDFCGQCRRCIEACPTGAILEDRRLDARRCISFLTIESRELPPAHLRDGIGDWLFGCDICQSVCPWNQKPFRPSAAEGQRQIGDETTREDLIADLKWILNSSGKTIEKSLHGTALGRAGGFGLKRNALIVAGNKGWSELRDTVLALRGHPRLGELAEWALQKISQESN